MGGLCAICRYCARKLVLWCFSDPPVAMMRNNLFHSIDNTAVQLCLSTQPCSANLVARLLTIMILCTGDHYWHVQDVAKKDRLKSQSCDWRCPRPLRNGSSFYLHFLSLCPYLNFLSCLLMCFCPNTCTFHMCLQLFRRTTFSRNNTHDRPFCAFALPHPGAGHDRQTPRTVGCIRLRARPGMRSLSPLPWGPAVAPGTDAGEGIRVGHTDQEYLHVRSRHLRRDDVVSYIQHDIHTSQMML